MSSLMEFAAYQAIDAINWSTLKHMGTSALAYKHVCESGRTDTSAMQMGRAIHTAVLEPDAFPLQYAVFAGARRAGKEWDAFEAANSDKEILKASEYETCLSVRDAVYANKSAAALLDGVSEVVRTWTDAETGLPCKCRIDHITSGGLNVDLKTTATIDRRLFEATAARLHYHGQAAFYERGNDNEGAPTFIIAVESAPPFDAAVFLIDAFALSIGDRDVSEYLSRVKACRESDVWPGRYEGVQELNLPAWMEAEAETFGGLFGGDDA